MVPECRSGTRADDLREDGQGLDPSAGERVTLWQDALQVIAQDPVMGTGL